MKSVRQLNPSRPNVHSSETAPITVLGIHPNSPQINGFMATPPIKLKLGPLFLLETKNRILSLSGRAPVSPPSLKRLDSARSFKFTRAFPTHKASL